MSNDLSRGLFPAKDVKLLIVDEAHKESIKYLDSENGGKLLPFMKKKTSEMLPEKSEYLVKIYFTWKQQGCIKFWGGDLNKDYLI